ncbi:hypothetical protein M434DRAFT_320573 [Hypoxylon sp. CO27-5]|nr:hypothetical protein M434DRAFT_320573 [Hypoxylon sp. CO27-5]
MRTVYHDLSSNDISWLYVADVIYVNDCRHMLFFPPLKSDPGLVGTHVAFGLYMLGVFYYGNHFRIPTDTYVYLLILCIYIYI